MNIEENIVKAAKVIKNADAILLTAGAGIGVDSGLPDFRGNQGFWKAYPPIAKLGISFSEMANPMWFERNPQLAWAFYGHRLNLYRNTIPHRGFKLMLDWAQKKELGYFVFTSNVDGQFQKAGFSEHSIYEVHGSIHHFQCTKPCSHHIWDASDINVDVDMETFHAWEPLPHCPKCNSIARPNILMFGDWSWLSDRSSTQSSRYRNWLKHLQSKKARLVIIESGAGHAVPTVRSESESVFRKMNAEFIRINPRDYDAPHQAISISMGTKEALEAIESKL
jgi:NAD-dependent SIR2 family protein deacetylase